MADTLFDRAVSPRVILPLLLVIVVILALLSPETFDVNNQDRLTTYSVQEGGARGFYQTADQLGWSVSRLESSFSDSMDRNVTYVLLSPPRTLRTREEQQLLAAVRGGASLLLVGGRRFRLLDSLGLNRTGSPRSEVDDQAGMWASVSTGRAGCRRSIPGELAGLDLVYETVALQDSNAVVTPLIVAAGRRGREHIAVGMQYGRGRVVVVTERRMFRNDVIRMCDKKEGVMAMRMLEWVSEPVGRRVVFDEYHHGFGSGDAPTRVIARGVAGSPSGRVAIQVAIAALVLLISAAARPIPPRPRERIERRSPFEHVGALARAYENVGATRRATRLFVRGLRRRHDAASWRGGSDEEYLRAIVTNHPSLAPDVNTVLTSMNNQVSPADFIQVGAAVDRIERKLSREHS